jgi:integrase
MGFKPWSHAEMELLRRWIALIRPQTEMNQMAQFKEMFGYQLAPTKYPSVFQRKEGGFLVRGRVKDLAGKQRTIFKVLDTTALLEAVKFLDSEKERVRTGSPKRASMLFSEFADDLFDQKIKRGEIRSEVGIDKWRIILSHLIEGTKVGNTHVPGFGDFPIDLIRVAHVEDWKDGLAAFIASDDYEPTTVNTWISILRVISKEASHRFEIKDFMTSVKKFPLKRVDPKANPNTLTPEVVADFLSIMRRRFPQHYALVYLGMFTGLRPSSLRPLRRRGPEADIDWTTGDLEVRQSQTKGTKVMIGTKTARFQTVSLPRTVLDVLKWHVETQLKNHDMQKSDLLFPSLTGGFRTRTALRNPFMVVVDELKLKHNFTPKGMRRAFNDLARQAEISSFMTRAISGHSTAQMQDHYSTPAPDEQRESLARVIDLTERRRRPVVSEVVSDLEVSGKKT